MRLPLALLLVIGALPTAFAQQPPRPPTPAAVPASGAAPAPLRAAQTAGGPNVFNPQRGAPSGGNPTSAGAGGPAQRAGLPTPPSGPQVTAGATPPAADVGPDVPQEVPAVFVGKLNGISVYRAAGGGYLFDRAPRPKVVPREAGSASAAASAPTAAVNPKK